MPRYPRNYMKTCYFHIIAQGINKSYIFEYEEDIKFYISNMNKLEKNCEINIMAYCVMNNHVHMLVEAPKIENLTKFMQRLNTTYAKYYNKKYNRVGYVFRNRYLAEGIYNERYLYNCMKYIYNNPVKANICKCPEEYPYSNCKKMKKVENNYDRNYAFMDIDTDENRICQNVILEFLENNKISKNELKQDKEMTKKLIIILKDEQKISLRRIADNLEINREKIRKIYNSI